MALASNEKECLHQNLLDARCSQRQIEDCMTMSDQGEERRMLLLLRAHRKELLNAIHEQQKALDSLDYLIFQTEKAGRRDPL